MKTPEGDSKSLDEALRATNDSVPIDVSQSRLIAARAWSVHQRRSRRRSRATVIAGLVGCYVAGLATMWSLGGGHSDVTTESRINLARDTRDVEPSPVQPATKEAERESAVTSIAQSDVQQAADRPASNSSAKEQSPYAIFCALGDDYLAQQNGIEAATECYALALERASEDELKVSVERDSWLLIALKRERRERI